MRALFASLLAAACACGGASDGRFGGDFLIGTAIAGFQAEMGCPTLPAARCEDRASDWYAFITRPELLADPSLHIAGDPPSSGPGFYELYEADLDRAAHELNGNALRLSIEWSRVFPTATDGLEGDALKVAANAEALASTTTCAPPPRASQPLFPSEAPLLTFDPFALDLRADASGISQALDAAAKYGLPIYVTETGIEDAADDGTAERWIGETLWRVQQARTRGAPIRGYFYWTLMDNYEWNHGMRVRLGLYAVDKDDAQKKRVVRARAAAALARVARERSVPPELRPH